MSARQLVMLLAAAAALLSSLAFSARPAEAKACGDVSAQGKVWIVGGAGASCKFQRRWTRGYLNHGDHPAGWSCHGRFAGSGGCDKNNSDAFFVFYPPD